MEGKKTTARNYRTGWGNCWSHRNKAADNLHKQCFRDLVPLVYVHKTQVLPFQIYSPNISPEAFTSPSSKRCFLRYSRIPTTHGMQLTDVDLTHLGSPSHCSSIPWEASAFPFFTRIPKRIKIGTESRVACADMTISWQVLSGPEWFLSPTKQQHKI